MRWFGNYDAPSIAGQRHSKSIAECATKMGVVIEADGMRNLCHGGQAFPDARRHVRGMGVPLTDVVDRAATFGPACGGNFLMGGGCSI